MYKVSKVPSGVISKRLHGLSGMGKFNNNSVRIIESISPPSGSRSPEDAARRSPSVESLTSTGPRPVFLGPAKKNNATNNRRGSRNGEKRQQPNGEHQLQQQVANSFGTFRPDEDVVSFFERSWSNISEALVEDNFDGFAEPSQTLDTRRSVVRFKPVSPSMPDFVPCNYERVWADHQYRKMIKFIDLTIQRGSQNIQEGKSF